MPKILRLHEFIGPDGLRIDEVDAALPESNEVRFKVDAFALNYGDFELMENGYVFSVKLPSRIGDEAAGIVDAVGPDVTQFEIGDRVSSLPWMNEGYGVDGEFAIVPETFLAHYPDNLSAVEGCSIWVTYLTAYYALVEISKVKEGDYVLITAGSSSAGMAAMDVAHLLGATAIGTTRTDANKQFILDSGFDHVIVTGTEDISERVQKISNGKGARVIYDPIGGPQVMEFAGAMDQNCDIYLYGGMDPRPTVVPEIEMTQKAAVLRPYSVYQHIYDEEQKERGIKYIYEALKSEKIKIRIDRTYPFEKFREAIDYQLKGKGRTGKIVITP